MNDAHAQSWEEVARALDTNPGTGLSAAEAGARLVRHGDNELSERGGKGVVRILWDQVRELLVVILLVAAGISFFLGEHFDAAVILVIVVLNTLFGFWQEYRAEKAITALKKLAVPKVRVRRDGQAFEIPAREVVPGDVLLVESGNLVPADGRLIEAAGLKAQESALTGESEPVEKGVDPVAGTDIPLGDRRNMLYRGTLLTSGRGAAVVTATGMGTELGRIATLLQEVEDEATPLQRRLARVGRALALAAVALIGVVVAVSLLRGEGWQVTFMTAISMAVAAIPESLPAVVTIALALGARRMLARNALIRSLPAVETLGSVTVICSDKTGTLTQNRMTVQRLNTGGGSIPIEQLDGEHTVPLDRNASLLLTAAALCNDASATPGAEADAFETLGDPTEAALVVAAAKAGLAKPALEARLPRIAEIPFDSERKRMTTLHRIPPGTPVTFPELLPPASPEREAPVVAFTKGAVDGLLPLCDRVLEADGVVPLNGEARQRILETNEGAARRGHRVLGIAFKPVTHDPPYPADEVEGNLIFLGTTEMIDPVREEAVASVRTCLQAGIRPVMITGDHPLTALHIARELHITRSDRAVTGRQLARMSEAELEAVVPEAPVYARVSPEHKLRIVDALQRRGEVVAMTGDGVNDAPALKSADIGVAMGRTGTDVSRASSDMVLLDDNFATIVAAVREGRIIYDNIRKFITYILTGNFAEILVMLLAPLLGMPLPLLPIQILWINLVTDGAPALAMSYEPGETGVMKRSPTPPGESVFARGVGRRILWVGLLVGLLSLAVGRLAYQADDPGRVWQTMIFTTLTFCQLAFACGVRVEERSVLGRAFFRNKVLLASVAGTFGAQLCLVYLPPLQAVFGTVSLSTCQLALCVGVSALSLAALEIEKLVLRTRRKNA